MALFKVQFRPGVSPSRQIVYSAKRAIVSGVLAAGEPFPSVRTLSQELKVNPNTAHKAVAQLIADGLLEVRPGVGTVVAANSKGGAAERAALLKDELEQLAVEAKRLQLDLDDVTDALRKHWNRLTPGSEKSR